MAQRYRLLREGVRRPIKDLMRIHMVLVSNTSLRPLAGGQMEELGAKRQNAEFQPDDDILLLAAEAAPMTQVTVHLSEPARGFVVFHGSDIVNPIEVDRNPIDDATWQLSLRSQAQYLFAVLDDQGDWDVSKRKTVRDEPLEFEL